MKGEIIKLLPEPTDAQGVVTTSVPYDVDPIYRSMPSMGDYIWSIFFSSQNPGPFTHDTYLYE